MAGLDDSIYQEIDKNVSPNDSDCLDSDSGFDESRNSGGSACSNAANLNGSSGPRYAQRNPWPYDPRRHSMAFSPTSQTLRLPPKSRTEFAAVCTFDDSGLTAARQHYLSNGSSLSSGRSMAKSCTDLRALLNATPPSSTSPSPGSNRVTHDWQKEHLKRMSEAIKQDTGDSGRRSAFNIARPKMQNISSKISQKWSSVQTTIASRRLSVSKMLNKLTDRPDAPVYSQNDDGDWSDFDDNEEEDKYGLGEEDNMTSGTSAANIQDELQRRRQERDSVLPPFASQLRPKAMKLPPMSLPHAPASDDDYIDDQSGDEEYIDDQSWDEDYIDDDSFNRLPLPGRPLPSRPLPGRPLPGRPLGAPVAASVPPLVPQRRPSVEPESNLMNSPPPLTPKPLCSTLKNKNFIPLPNCAGNSASTIDTVQRPGGGVVNRAVSVNPLSSGEDRGRFRSPPMHENVVMSPPRPPPPPAATNSMSERIAKIELGLGRGRARPAGWPQMQPPMTAEEPSGVFYAHANVPPDRHTPPVASAPLVPIETHPSARANNGTAHRRVDVNQQAPPRFVPMVPSSLNNAQASGAPLRATNTPLPPVPACEEAESLSSFPWYFGEMSAGQVKSRLERHAVGGAFMVRKSSSRSSADNPFTLTLFHDSRFWKLGLRRRRDQKFAVGSPKDNETAFRSVPALIEFYQRNPLSLVGGGQVILSYPPPPT